MVSAFLLFLQKKHKVEEVTKRYQRSRMPAESIEVRIKHMTKKLEDKLSEKKIVNFTELLPDEANKYDVMLSFMSLLSMVKELSYDADQEEAFGEITVRRKEIKDV